MTELEWIEDYDEYPIREPFGGGLKTIKIREKEVDNELLTGCVENHIISEVAKGYFITHDDIEKHQDFINKYGIEAYLRKRLEVPDDQ